MHAESASPGIAQARTTARPPRVLYVGPLNTAGTCRARLEALRALEPDVHTFDSEPYFSAIGRLRNFAERLLLAGPLFARLNSDLRRTCTALRPDVLWVDKGFWIWPATLRQLRKHGTLLVHHNTDALWPRVRYLRWMYTLLRRTVALYDLSFTTNLDDYRRLSAQYPGRIALTHLGYDHTRFDATPLPPSVAVQWANDLVFIGHHEPRTERGIRALIDAGLSVAVYGWGWEKAAHPERLMGHVHYRQLDNADYLHALKGAKIALCFVSELNGNQTAGRSFEIPACGTFLLALRTPQHGQCYREGVEAEFFESDRELIGKARHYLAHEDRRAAIARRGRIRCVTSDYSWARYMRDDWQKVNDVLKGGSPACSTLSPVARVSSAAI